LFRIVVVVIVVVVVKIQNNRCLELGKKLQAGNDQVVSVFDKTIDFLRMYEPYVNNYENACKTIKNLSESNSKFGKFIEERRNAGQDLQV